MRRVSLAGFACPARTRDLPPAAGSLRRARLAAFAFLALAAGLRGAPPAGTVTCATCHRSEAESQPKTAMGIGMELPPDQVLLKAHPKLSFEKNGYHYAIERKDNASIYTVSNGADTIAVPIQYAFGVYMETFVLEYQGRFFESLVSYYPSIDGLEISPGDERLPRNLIEAMGREITTREATNCFGCHGTGGASHGKLTLDSLQPGLTCEHCHDGANVHLEAIVHGKPAPLPKKLGQLAAEDMAQFCGQCHRTWETAVRERKWSEVNVRFQPYRLSNSKCFMGDDKRISCTACHNPHADPAREETAYDHNCLACHNAKTPAVAAAGKVTAKICPVAQSKCVSCHMPKVQVPGCPPGTLFTDHYIRVVRAGDPYPN